MIVNEVVLEAERRGQGPEENYEGEYVYEYDSKAIVMGQDEDVVYLRCIDESSRFSEADSWPILAGTLKQSSVVSFKNLRINNKEEGQLCWGLRNKSHGEGIYYTHDENANVVVSFLKLLCWSEPQKNDETELD